MYTLWFVAKFRLDRSRYQHKRGLHRAPNFSPLQADEKEHHVDLQKFRTILRVSTVVGCASVGQACQQFVKERITSTTWACFRLLRCRTTDEWEEPTTLFAIQILLSYRTPSTKIHHCGTVRTLGDFIGAMARMTNDLARLLRSQLGDLGTTMSSGSLRHRFMTPKDF